jgi:hypothetical protein
VNKFLIITGAIILGAFFGSFGGLHTLPHSTNSQLYHTILSPSKAPIDK